MTFLAYRYNLLFSATCRGLKCKVASQNIQVCYQVSFASRIQETGPSSYLHILQEAHLLLRWELRRQVTLDPTLLDLFQESCALLGDYYSWPRQDDWHLCLPYYQKSGMRVDEVVRQAIQHRQHSKEQTSVYVYGRGLMAYLDWVLFRSDVPLDMKEDTSNSVLNIYAQTSPEQLPTLLLLSRLQNYSPETAQRLLTELSELKESRGEQSSTLDQLANVKGELVQVCTAHPEIIHTGVSEFTPLGQLMRCHTPTTLLQILAEIVGGGAITLESCLQLLENNCDTARCRNNQVREFLEIVLNDARRKFWFEEAASLLCEIYVQRLLLGLRAQPQSHVGPGPPRLHMPSGNGHFATRFSWLDHIPPVNSPSALTARCPHVSMVTPSGLRTSSLPLSMHTGGAKKGGEGEAACTCAFCLQDLLKLQSLLCSNRANPELVRQVQGLVEARTDMIGWDSIWILCNFRHQTKVVTEFVVDKYHQIVAKFATSLYERHLDKWQLLLRCLEGRLREATSVGSRSASPSESDQNTLLSAYKDVLSEMVELFSAEEFLMALPADGSMYFLLPFITRSLQRKHLTQLKGHITSKGKALMTHLTTES
ncbi:hypothetical protein BaRGS_00017798 [Batillaria attramentaria]|uniref:BLOC-2 complex member HPS3 C-terminal domain-containing protein n=1 Tax=Batillaria attramentaria TaxID=370345 RepID=A0ABD0KV92_9CAEN